MGDVRAHGAGLVGQTLRTTGPRRMPFDVVASDPSGVTIHLHSTDKDRLVPWQQIEAASLLGLHGKEITPLRLREAGASEAHPAYVAAILRAVDA